jgi:hypothetical protein
MVFTKFSKILSLLSISLSSNEIVLPNNYMLRAQDFTEIVETFGILLKKYPRGVDERDPNLAMLIYAR